MADPNRSSRPQSRHQARGALVDLTPAQSMGLSSILFVLHFGTSSLSSIWLLRWLSSDGLLSGADLALAVVLTVCLFIALSTLSVFGIKKLPQLSGPLLRAGVVVWVLAQLVIGTTSMLTSAATLAGSRGQVIHQETYLMEAKAAYNERSNLVRSLEGQLPALAGCHDTADDAKSREGDTGEISKDKGGEGQTTRELRTIGDACQRAGYIIVESRPTTAPLFKEAERAMETMRRTVEDPRRTVREKDEALLAGSEKLAEIESKLVAAMSLPSLDGAVEIMERDYTFIGLSDSAVQYIQSTFGPIARQITTVVDEARYVLREPFPTFEKRDSLALLALYPGQLFPALTLAAVLELVPLIIIGFSILSELQRRAGDRDEASDV